MSVLQAAQEHRRLQLGIRAQFLRIMLDLWRLLVLGDMRSTLEPWSQRSTDAVLEYRARSARAAVDFYSQARALPPPPIRLPAPPRPIPPRPGGARTAPLPDGLPMFPRPPGTGGPPPGVRPGPPRAGGRPAVPPRHQRRPVYSPAPAPPPDREQTRRRLTGAVVGRVSEQRQRGIVDLDRLGRDALAETSRVASQLVLDGGRRTIEQAIETDPASVGWCRLTAADPCAFCAMQASRGFVFRSADTAGEKYHPGCACLPMPRFRDDTSPLPPGNQHWADLWAKTAGHFGGDPAAARRAWRRAIEAERAGEDPVEAAFRGTDRSPDDAPRARRQRTRKGRGQEERARLRRLEDELAGLMHQEPPVPDADEAADLLEQLRRSVDEARARVGPRITPDEALVS